MKRTKETIDNENRLIIAGYNKAIGDMLKCTFCVSTKINSIDRQQVEVVRREVIENYRKPETFARGNDLAQNWGLIIKKKPGRKPKNVRISLPAGKNPNVLVIEKIEKGADGKVLIYFQP